MKKIVLLMAIFVMGFVSSRGQGVVPPNSGGTPPDVYTNVTWQTIFFDDFDGPTLNPIWQTNLPNILFPYTDGITTYIGAPNYSFQTLGTNSVLRLTNTIGPVQRVGWSSVTNFNLASFYYDARFNTLTQSPSNSIDGFVEIWIIDAANSNRYDIVSPFGGSFSSDPTFFVGSSIDNTFTHNSFPYQNNTWYHLVLQDVPGENIRASVYDDNGNELMGRTLAHDVSAYSSGFKIALSQSVGTSYVPSPVDVAVDYVKLSTGTGAPPAIVTQPADQSVSEASTALFSVVAGGTGPLSYQWSFNGANISGATGASLTLTDVQLNQAGDYAVLVSSPYGTTNSANAVLTVNARPPTIVTQVVDQSVFESGTASFSIVASGTAPLTYQWSLNGTNINGATNSVLTLVGVQLSQAGEYAVSVSSPYGSTNSVNALLTVNARPPAFVTEPGNQSIVIGGTATLSVVASGTAPLVYQWSFDGTNIIGATDPILTLVNVQTNQAGVYSVVVSSPYGTTNSVNASLTINQPLTDVFFDDFDGPTLNANWQTNLPNTPFPYGTVQYLGGPNYGFEMLGTNSVLRLTNVMSSLQRVGWSSVTNYAGTNFYYDARFNTLNQSQATSVDAFFEIWIIDATNTARYDIVAPFGGGYDSDLGFAVDSSIDNSYSRPSFTYQNNTWYHLVLQSSQGENIRASIYDDYGNELIGTTLAHGPTAFASGFKIGLSQSLGTPGANYPVDVAVDYVKLAAQEFPGVPPTIATEPTNQVILENGAATFSVVVQGAEPFNYQWSLNGTNIIDATNSTLILTNVQPAEAGNYAVTISNLYGSTNSDVAVLNLELPPVISQQPTNQSVVSYGNASFIVAASGTGPLSYQWRLNDTNLLDGGNISGSATPNLIITGVTSADAGNYDVVVSNPYATTNSTAATLTLAETAVSLGSTNGISGGTITVPVFVNAVGLENTLVASIAYDPTKLVLQNVQLAPEMTDAYLIEVDSQTNNGYVGFGIELNTGDSLSVGLQEVALVNFVALPVTSNTAVNLAFADVPNARQVLDNSFDLLPTTYTGGAVSLIPAEYEADVFPRFTGDHQVNAQDWGEEGRMVAGLDVPTNSDELLRADCAPRNAPDGVLTVADWVQAGRYALGLDPLTLVNQAGPAIASKVQPRDQSPSLRTLQIGSVSDARGQIVSVPVQLVCVTNENAAGMTINYDTTKLKLLNVSLGSAMSGAKLNVNTNKVVGEIGLALALSPGVALPAGTNQVAVIQFLSSTNASGTAAVGLDSSVVTLQVVDKFATALPTTYASGAVVLPQRPTVGAAAMGSNLQLSWAVDDGSFQVLTATNPTGPWTTVILPLVTNGANVNVMVTTTNQQQYYRLVGQ